MKVTIDFTTLPWLFNAKVKDSKDVKDLSNIKFVISYFERNKKIDALKKSCKNFKSACSIRIMHKWKFCRFD